MSLDNIVSGDYGQNIVLTILDTDTNAAADVSSYGNTIQMLFTDPAGDVTVKTATFVSDGSDGQIQYTTESGLINQAGEWRIRGRVAGASSRLSSIEKKFTVRQ